MFSKKPEQPAYAAPQQRMASSGNATFSVIGADVVIKGDVMASADLHVDGQIEGDITCAALVQGEGSRIEGAIAATSARLSGAVIGTIKAGELVIQKGAQVDGDVYYDTLTIEQGASVEGRLSLDTSTHAKNGSADSLAAEKPGEAHLSLAG